MLIWLILSITYLIEGMFAEDTNYYIMSILCLIEFNHGRNKKYDR